MQNQALTEEAIENHFEISEVPAAETLLDAPTRKPGMLPAYATRARFKKLSFLSYCLLHGGLLLAPFTFTIPGLISLVLIKIATGCLGITLCYHRLLTHRSYKTPKWVRYFLATCGVLALQRGPIWWTATHRLHHSQVDTELDPHTPAVSFLWSHIFWAFFKHPILDETPDARARMARDIAEDKGMQFLEKHYAGINVAFFALLFGVGYLFGGMKMGLSIFVWGGLLRALASLHATWFVNSAAHLWGYRNYHTNDTSRNNWWVAFFTFGEGWHNNHHADQRAARNGHRWFEFDLTYCIILLMHRLGMAYDIVPVSERVKTLKVDT